MRRGLVSICVPTFNGEKYLEEALASIKHQTYRNFEVIISDDNSSDRTMEILNAFKEETDFPVFVYSHKPSGIGANWNNCIKKAKGKYIKFLFQDDILSATCLKEMVEILENQPEIGLVGCKRNFIIHSSCETNVQQWMEVYGDLQKYLDTGDKKILYLDHKLIGRKDFLKSPYNKIGEPSSVIFRKSVVKKSGFFDTDLEQILDYVFYYRLLKFYSIAIINKPLVSFRIHQDQTTNHNRIKKINDYKRYDEILFEEFFDYLNAIERQRIQSKFSRYRVFLKLLKLRLTSQRQSKKWYMCFFGL